MYSTLFLFFLFFSNVYGDFMFLNTPAKADILRDNASENIIKNIPAGPVNLINSIRTLEIYIV